MATITSAATGNFSAGATWVGGVAPGTGDDAVAATGHTVTINTNTTVLSIQSSGGVFRISNGVTLTCTATNGILGPSAGTNATLGFNLGSGNSATVIGNVVGSAAVGVQAVRIDAAGTLNITGNVTGGSAGTSAYGVYILSAAGRCNVTGNVTGGSGTNAVGIWLEVAGSRVDVTGTVTGGSNAPGITQGTGGGTVNVTGNVTGAATAGVRNANVGAVTDITGTVSASTTTCGLLVSQLTTTPAVVAGNLIDASNGACAVQAVNMAIRPTVNGNYNDYLHSNGSSRTYRGDAAYWTTSGEVPVAANVRYGTTYGSGTLTGTLRVPDRNSVAYGALVDNTTGLAWLAPSDVSSVIGAAIAAALDSVP